MSSKETCEQSFKCKDCKEYVTGVKRIIYNENTVFKNSLNVYLTRLKV